MIKSKIVSVAFNVLMKKVRQTIFLFDIVYLYITTHGTGMSVFIKKKEHPDLYIKQMASLDKTKLSLSCLFLRMGPGGL